ncbi:DUF1206 domain-containing protein [Actinomadura macra]|uniref:DUF1206 domain-containing protein n=1 Tax=Actinomadura macra TaxID=46164 RepID=UPI000AD34847|nr:DUF1206 domain-containing protein [Actinomadura macra]
MTPSMTRSKAQRAGRQAAGHGLFHALSRAGLATHGIIYLLIGWLALQIGLGRGGADADKKGALQTVVDNPGGMVMLWLLVVGFAGMALWRCSEALYGQPVPDGNKPTKRLASLARAVIYTAIFISVLLYALGRGGKSSDEQSKSFTAQAMAEPGGRWLVLAVGLGFLAYGIANIISAVRHEFLEELRTEQMSRRVRTGVKVLGVIGTSARGLVFAGIGVFIAHAAITFDADKAKGLDGTLRELADTPAGPWLLVGVAIGLMLYGAYNFCEARWRKVEAVRS